MRTIVCKYYSMAVYFAGLDSTRRDLPPSLPLLDIDPSIGVEFLLCSHAK